MYRHFPKVPHQLGFVSSILTGYSMSFCLPQFREDVNVFKDTFLHQMFSHVFFRYGLVALLNGTLTFEDYLMSKLFSFNWNGAI